MKITREQLKEIIKEELDREERKVLQEGPNVMDMVKFPALLKKIIPLLQETFGQDINVYQFLIDMAEFYAKDPDFFDRRPQYTDDLASDLGLRETEDDYDRFKDVSGYEDERVPGKTASQVRRRNLPPEEPKPQYADDLHLYLEKENK